MSTLRRFAPLIAIIGLLGLATLIGVVLAQENHAPEVGPQVATVDVGESPRSTPDGEISPEPSGPQPTESAGKQAAKPSTKPAPTSVADPPGSQPPAPVPTPAPAPIPAPVPAPAPAPQPQPQPPLNYQPYYDDDWDDDDWDDDDWDDDDD